MTSISSSTRLKEHTPTVGRQSIESAVVRFAGDSGDGIQLIGGRFALTSAISGNDLATFPDFPAEIRAPTGTTYGVSAFQINFGSRFIKTSGDAPDVLIALNPAALKVELKQLRRGGTLIVDSGSFTARNLRKAGYESNPLSDGTLTDIRLIEVDISHLTLEAVKPLNLSKADALRCKNMWALGLIYWMFERDCQHTIKWIKQKFRTDSATAEANIVALQAGHAFGETAELEGDFSGFHVGAAPLPPGVYRSVTGGEATAWGLTVGAHLAGLALTFASYPITPASPILHTLARFQSFGVTTFQAEDEIAAACAAIGASYAGAIGVTSSSGPGIALKAEALSLAVAVELPLVVINTQRAGPSTGMPTKTEQADLNMALFGRHGESPVVVLAARSPADCFDVAIEAVRLATRYMTPVILLTDGYIANASQAWSIPDVEAMEPFTVQFESDLENFSPFKRDPLTLARPWALPGTPGLEHRIGGIEKDFETGHISYDPANHQKMTDVRAEKIARIANDIPLQAVDQGPDHGRLALIGWGSTYGAISRAVSVMIEDGLDVSHIHIRHLSPLPQNLGDVLRRFDKLLVVENNSGQLRAVLRNEYLLDIEGLNKVAGKPFTIQEVEQAILERLSKQ